MTKTILAVDKGLARQVELLDEHFDVVRLWDEKDPEEFLAAQGGRVSALTSSLAPVSRAMIEALPNLEIIANCAVGYDNIDLDICRQRGIIVTNTPDVLTNDTSDVALLLMLNVMRRAVEGDAFLRAGMWGQGKLGLGACLSDKIVGIVGLGRIGQAIARRVSGFDMTVVYNGPNEKTDQPYRYYSDLKEMARDVDVLIAVCPANEDTEELIDLKVLQALGHKGFFINVARGSVVQKEDLLIALRNRDIAGAGLDVYWNEPNVPQDLIKMDNVVLTPHIGSATFETRHKMGQLVLGNLLAHFDGKPLLTQVQL